MRYSFCITTKNDAPTLRKSLDSLLSQLPEDSEVVVADGGSKDGALDILRDYATEGKLKLLSGEYNRGEGRQMAFEASIGKIIIDQIDTDNVYLPNLKRLLALYHRDFEGRMLRVEVGPTIAPRELMEELGGWKPLFGGEDVDLWNRAKEAGRFSVISFPIVDSFKRHGHPKGWRGLPYLIRLFWSYKLTGHPVKLSWKSRPLWWAVSFWFKVSGAKRP